MFLFLFISVAFSACSLYKPFIYKEELLPCFRLADMNHNDELSEMEIITFLDAHNITDITLTKIMNNCDIDHDGKLTMYDFNAPRSCLRLMSTRTGVCWYCNKIN